ncbi:MAG: GntR family transcriptional regulator [Turicibacter sp.]|nr:GntR family transcriptional regulator [Turicibacter sp.]
MVLDRSKDSKPLYLQIKDILKQKIITNEYPVGSTIPSENVLEEMFEVSRMTIRQAVNELVNEGLLRKERGRGKGTIVLSNAIADKLSTVKSFTQKMHEQGLVLQNKHVNLSLVIPDETVASALNTEAGEKVLRLSRIRMVNNDIIMFSISYLPASLNLPLDTSVYNSLYLLLSSYNIQISHAEEYIEAMLANNLISEALEVSLNAAVLKRTRISQDQYNRNIEYTTTYYRSDKYKYVVELTV